jgi:catechol 2,3-dioxygenase-like lactoylglutathione lyase family enzyme
LFNIDRNRASRLRAVALDYKMRSPSVRPNGGGVMDLSIKRIIIFTRAMPAMARFYRDVLGLKQKSDESGWKEFHAGACDLALHSGSSAVGSRPPKIVFFSADVATTREALLKRGAKLGKVNSQDGLDLCDGTDPDGNPFQISNRP